RRRPAPPAGTAGLCHNRPLFFQNTPSYCHPRDECPIGRIFMKKLLLATATLALSAGLASAEEVKIGLSLGFTGPPESLPLALDSGAELAVKEVSDSGKLLDGSTVTAVRADNTCTDAAAWVAADERLVASDKVKGMMGGMGSGETIASLERVGVPNGMVMIS